MPDADGARGGAGLWLSSELGARVASALILAALALWVTAVGGWPLALFWLAAGIAILIEWTAMTRIEPRLPMQLLLGAALVALAGLAFGLLSFRFAGLIVILLGGSTMVLVKGGRSRIWALMGLASAAVIVIVPPLLRAHPQLGLVALIWMFAVVWATDTAAYFTGRRFGGPKLWPRVSPKKTWSGFGGGLAAGATAGVVVPLIATELGWSPPVGWPAIAAVSALASVVSQFGDLAESALKRRFGVKDAGQLIPGHGGVMDRLDGFWAVALLMGGIVAGMSAMRS